MLGAPLLVVLSEHWQFGSDCGSLYLHVDPSKCWERAVLFFWANIQVEDCVRLWFVVLACRSKCNLFDRDVGIYRICPQRMSFEMRLKTMGLIHILSVPLSFELLKSGSNSNYHFSWNIMGIAVLLYDDAFCIEIRRESNPRRNPDLMRSQTLTTRPITCDGNIWYQSYIHGWPSG